MASMSAGLNMKRHAHIHSLVSALRQVLKRGRGTDRATYLAVSYTVHSRLQVLAEPLLAEPLLRVKPLLQLPISSDP